MQCSLFEPPIKTSKIEGTLVKKYTNQPVSDVSLLVFVSDGLFKQKQIGQSRTLQDGSFNFNISTECPTYELLVQYYNFDEGEGSIQLPPSDYLDKSFYLSNTKNHNLKLFVVYGREFRPDFHNTKPFDKNDKLVAEYYQNGKLISNVNNLKKGMEEFLGDSLDFKTRYSSWKVEGNTYLKIKMMITKNGRTVMKEDSIFCKPTRDYYVTKRIEY